MPLYRRVAEKAQEWGSRVGIVVGATYPAQLAEMRSAFPDTFFLIPGYGAQGGSAADLAPGFGRKSARAVVNSSRAIACAWQKTGLPYKDAARQEALSMRDALRSVLRERQHGL